MFRKFVDNLESLSVDQLRELADKVGPILSRRLKAQRQANLEATLVPVTWEQLVFHNHDASWYTPPSMRKRFAGGFFLTRRWKGKDTPVYNSVACAKTKTGVLYEFNWRSRKWEKY